MIQLSNITMPIGHTQEELKREIQHKLQLPFSDFEFQIRRRSIDARKKIHYVYTVLVTFKRKEKEEKWVKGGKNPTIKMWVEEPYCFMNLQKAASPSAALRKRLLERPVIVGTGPAGLFCAYLLAQAGYQPLILERGQQVEDRVKEVETFFETGIVSTDTNVQFGEGGAGTFSDGKLHTLVKDIAGRNRFILELFVKYGAPEEILYDAKPHIGTDRLREVVKNIREAIKKKGGIFRFQTKLEKIVIEKNQIRGIITQTGEKILCSVLVLAIGHSARDTFQMLYETGIPLQEKAFAIGLRIEHSQQRINQNQYGEEWKKLGAADYKLTHQCKNGRGVYSFCMCPGGFVVNASSEHSGLVVNGMSNYARDSKNANSALIVTVTPEDFQRSFASSLSQESRFFDSQLNSTPLLGMEFQRKWEKAAFLAGNASGKIPVQLLGDFQRNRISTGFGTILPMHKGKDCFANLRDCLPEYVTESLLEGIQAFEQKIQGFSTEEAILSGVETRTSSPVRIVRKENMESELSGLYPCGEGAGYAGGITSSAMDGMKAAEAIAANYIPAF